MKVESSSDAYIGAVAAGPHKAAEHAPASTQATGAAAQTGQPAGVQLTLSATTQSSPAGGVGDSAVFNAEKVEAMRQAIANGTFRVNPEAIADKLLANAAEMLGAAASTGPAKP
jgi:negative regulator of flagellin synthesis FlgM